MKYPYGSRVWRFHRPRVVRLRRWHKSPTFLLRGVLLGSGEPRVVGKQIAPTRNRIHPTTARALAQYFS